MKTPVYGQDQRVSEWVIPRIGGDHNFGLVAATIGLEEDGKLIAGVVYNLYTGPSICMNVAADQKGKWLSRDFLFRVFAYPFIQLKCRRVGAFVREDNAAAIKMDEGLGFVREGLLRNADHDGTNMIVYGMLAHECKWIRVKR